MEADEDNSEVHLSLCASLLKDKQFKKESEVEEIFSKYQLSFG